MAIVTGELLWYFSTTAGSAGNSTAGTAAGSLGKYISTTQWTGGTLHDLFDVITGDENAASTVDYRCVFVRNSNGSSLALQNAKFFLNGAQTSGGATIDIGIDPAGATPIGQAGAQAAQIANETTAPSGVSFSAPTTKAGSTISLASLPAGQCVALWIRRTAANSAAQAGDGATPRIEGDTAA